MRPRRSARWREVQKGPFVAVDEFHGGGPPDEDGGPALPVMHDLDEGAPDLTTGAEVVLDVEEGGNALHFCGEGGSDLQFAKNQCGGFGTAPRCKGDVVE